MTFIKHKQLYDVKLFNEFFIDNYKNLVKDAQKITNHNPYYDMAEDFVHDNYIKILNRIALSGFTGSNFRGYFFMAMKNDFRVLKNREKVRHFVPIDTVDNDNGWEYGKTNRSKAEQYLLEEEEWNKDQEQYHTIIESIVIHLFKYVQIKYNDKQTYLFITYFLEGDTYKQLSERTGVDISIISKTIKPMKLDIKNNFQTYINQKRNE